MKASIESTAALLLIACVGACSGPDGHSDNNTHDEDGGHHEDDQHHDGGHDVGAPDVAPDTTLSEAAFAYCDCMLVNCHDPFHDTWGEDDAESRTACAEEASALPVAGSPQTSGNSIECRQHVCEGVVDRRFTCEDALGSACQ